VRWGGVRVVVGTGFFISPLRSERFSGPPCLLSNYRVDGGKATGAQSWQFTSIEGCDLEDTCTWSSLPDRGKNLYLRHEIQTDCGIQLTCYLEPGILSSKPETDHLPGTRTVEWKAYNYLHIPYAPSWCGVEDRNNFTFTPTVTLDPDTCHSPAVIYFTDPATPVHVKREHEK
jgi:hypothetical protein